MRTPFGCMSPASDRFIIGFQGSASIRKEPGCVFELHPLAGTETNWTAHVILSVGLPGTFALDTPAT